VDVRGVDGDLIVRGQRGYYEIACRPMETREAVERIARGQIAAGRRGGRYESGAPVIVAVHGADGTFPAFDGKPDIAAAEPGESDIAAANDTDIYIVKAEYAVDGRLVA
jgi:hypothetical protein